MKRAIFEGVMYFIVLWALMSVMFFLTDRGRGLEVEFMDRAIFGFFVSLGPLLVIVWSMRSLFPSLKYLERNNIERPIFKRNQVRSFEIDVPEDFEFSRLKTEIAEKWKIIFSDDVSGVLKFRNKLNFLEWGGIGVWMKYDNVARKIHTECFSMSGNRIFVREAQELQKEIEDCLGLRDLFALARDDE